MDEWQEIANRNLGAMVEAQRQRDQAVKLLEEMDAEFSKEFGLGWNAGDLLYQRVHSFLDSLKP